MAWRDAAARLPRRRARRADAQRCVAAALLCCVVAACVRVASAVPLGMQPDVALPPTLRVCVQGYPPFVVPRVWAGMNLTELLMPPGFDEPSELSGIVFSAAQLDGFDVEFVKLVVTQYLGLDVTFVPYPDMTSFYVGLRNGNCDFAASGVELDPQRAACPASCPDPTQQLLPVYPEGDYIVNPTLYQLRLSQDICCLEYSTSYYMSGFALMSRLQRTRLSVLDAIFSMEILNVAMPVLCGLISFGTIMWLLERRVNPAFKNQTAGIYYAFVSLSTFGFGDLAPSTTLGRLLTIIWTVFSVFSLTAFGGTISSKLTVAQLSVSTIDAFNQISAADICIESNYLLVNRLIAETYSLDLDERGRVNAPGSVMLGTVATCAQAVLDGTVKAYVSDAPVLQWLAYEYLDATDLYVSPPVRKNPMSWAFPRGSPLRPVLDAAIMKMLVNGTWLQQYSMLTTQWFPSELGSSEPDPNNDLLVGPFVAAMVLTATWLLGLAGEEGWRAYGARTAPRGKQADAEAGTAAAEVGGPPEQRIAEALAQEATAAAAAAQAASDRAAELLKALAAARAAAMSAQLAAAPVEAT